MSIITDLEIKLNIFGYNKFFNFLKNEELNSDSITHISNSKYCRQSLYSHTSDKYSKNYPVATIVEHQGNTSLVLIKPVTKEIINPYSNGGDLSQIEKIESAFKESTFFYKELNIDKNVSFKKSFFYCMALLNSNSKDLTIIKSQAEFMSNLYDTLISTYNPFSNKGDFMKPTPENILSTYNSAKTTTFFKSLHSRSESVTKLINLIRTEDRDKKEIILYSYWQCLLQASPQSQLATKLQQSLWILNKDNFGAVSLTDINAFNAQMELIIEKNPYQKLLGDLKAQFAKINKEETSLSYKFGSDGKIKGYYEEINNIFSPSFTPTTSLSDSLQVAIHNTTNSSTGNPEDNYLSNIAAGL